MNVKYPAVHVKLVGEDGNAFSIIGRVVLALQRARVTNDEITAFKNEATSGDYENLLGTCMRWVTCD